jgi:hypothetical protein
MTAAELVADLQRPWHHGEHVEARDIVLDEPLVLDGMIVRGFDLSGAKLNGGLSARGTRFRGLAWLRNATIKGPCDLREASFRTDLRADHLTADDVQLEGCEFQGVLSLAGATLRSLSLRNALMLANLTLEGARIDGEVVLDGAEIMGGLWSAEAGIGAFDHGEADIFGRLRLPG